MKEEEAKKTINKNVRILLSNNFSFSGKVLDVSEETLKLFDKFGNRVSIKLSDIMVLTEVSQ